MAAIMQTTLYIYMHFTKGLSAYHWNFVKILSAVIFIPMFQSGYSFAHAMTDELSWHVQNCDMIGSIYLM